MHRLTALPRKASSWIARSPQERSQILQTYGLLLLVTLALKWRGLRWTQTRLAQYISPLQAHQPPVKSVLPIIRRVRLIVRYSPWSNCLRQSLVLWYLLRRQGLKSELRIGMRRQEGVFQAHAWVEYQGDILNDIQGVRQLYATFPKPIELIDIADRCKIDLI